MKDENEYSPIDEKGRPVLVKYYKLTELGKLILKRLDGEITQEELEEKLKELGEGDVDD